MSRKQRTAVYVGKSTRHEPASCLNCGKVLDGATSVGSKAKPRAGAITICIGCGHLQAYGWDMKFRELTDEEVLDCAGDERVLAIQRARGEMEKLKAAAKAGFKP